MLFYCSYSDYWVDEFGEIFDSVEEYLKENTNFKIFDSSMLEKKEEIIEEEDFFKENDLCYCLYFNFWLDQNGNIINKLGDS